MQPVEILSDTQGIDFSPYLKQALNTIYGRWVDDLPGEAKAPTLVAGRTDIRVTIGPDGAVTAMHLDAGAQDAALNKAAWAAVTSVGKFPPLPAGFHGPNLQVRIHFVVNETVAVMR